MTGWFFFKTVLPNIGFILLGLALTIHAVRLLAKSMLWTTKKRLELREKYLDELEWYHREAKGVFKRYLVGDVSTTEEQLYKLTQPIEKAKELEEDYSSDYRRPYGTRPRSNRMF